MSPPNFHREDLDAAYSIADELAFSVCHALAKKEGLLLGGSTGSIVAAGMAWASGQCHPQQILMINPDRGYRYLETIYDSEWLAKNALRISSGMELETAITALKPVFEAPSPTWPLVHATS